MHTVTVLTTQEAAAALRCSLRTVYRLLERGELRGAFRVGDRVRIPLDAITALRDASRLDRGDASNDQLVSAEA